jgi:hydrogenase/urease accessory protein HupE
MLRARVLTALLIILGAPAAALAHEPGLSALEVRVARMHLVIDLSLAARDAEDAARQHASGGVELFSLRAIRLSTDGRSLPARVEAVTADDAGGVRIRLTCERPAGDQLVVRSVIPRLLARGHRQLLSVRAADGTLIAQQMLDGQSAEAAVDLRIMGVLPGSAFTFFLLGVAHILHGYDHLLFLAGLLVVARRTTDAVKAVTAFTVAHSVTLVLTVAGWTELPPSVAEPLIAASIVYVGAENLLRSDVTRRWGVTFAFGLIHGFGFAGAMRELGVGQDGGAIALPLASFNVGVEAGQIAVATALVPIVSRLRAYPAIGARVATVSSAVVLLAGICWLVARTGAFV